MIITKVNSSDNRDRFKVSVLIDEEEKATAEDFSKKSAEQLASKEALEVLGVFAEEAQPTDS